MKIPILTCFAAMSVFVADGTDAALVAAYKAQAAKAGRSAELHAKLALWCESKDMAAEREAELAEAVKLSANHPLARALTGRVRHGGVWKSPEEVAESVAADSRRGPELRLYDEKRATGGDGVAAHLALADWCEKHGLLAESRAHHIAVIRLDPTRDASWSKLGYKRVDGQPVSKSAAATIRKRNEEARKAYGVWGARLEGLVRDLGVSARKSDAEARLAALNDPLAAAPIWDLLVPRGPQLHRLAARLLSQIQGPEASARLAMLGAFNTDGVVADTAIQALAWRDPREYAATLLSFLRPPLLIESQNFQGPGSVAWVKVDGVMVSAYREPHPPADKSRQPMTLAPMPRVNSAFMSAGLPSANDPFALQGFLLSLSAAGGGRAAPSGLVTNPGLRLPSRSASNADAVVFDADHPQGTSLAMLVATPLDPRPGDDKDRERERERDRKEKDKENSEEKKRKAYEAERDRVRAAFARDLNLFRTYNNELIRVSTGVYVVLEQVTGLSLPRNMTAWHNWWNGWNRMEDRDLAVEVDEQALAAFSRPGHGRLAAGTPVWTERGRSPIESIRIGDRLLRQNLFTGELAYESVVAVTREIVDEGLEVRFRDALEPLLVTKYQRLWRPGLGWGVAGMLQPGDRIRGLSSVLVVDSVRPSKRLPGYNVMLAGPGAMLAGERPVLAHDSGVDTPPSQPFDAVSGPAAAPDGSRPLRGRPEP